MRPKKQKTQFFTHRQQKIPRTKPQKRKNKQQQNNHCCFFIAFASTIQFSHNTPPHKQHPTTCDPKQNSWATTSKKVLLTKRGDFIEQQPCCSRHPTACHKNKTNHQNQNTNTLILVSLIPHTHIKPRVILAFTWKQKLCHHTQNPRVTTKTCHHQVLTSTHTVTKQILYSP